MVDSAQPVHELACTIGLAGGAQALERIARGARLANGGIPLALLAEAVSELEAGASRLEGGAARPVEAY